MRKLAYILVNIVFFNLCVWLFYYLGLVNHTNFLIFDNFLDIVITNVVFFLAMLLYSLIYEKFLIDKFGYWKIAGIGIAMGVIATFFVINATFQEKLFLVLFISFSCTFLSYSIYFNRVKDNVFM